LKTGEGQRFQVFCNCVSATCRVFFFFLSYSSGSSHYFCFLIALKIRIWGGKNALQREFSRPEDIRNSTALSALLLNISSGNVFNGLRARYKQPHPDNEKTEFRCTVISLLVRPRRRAQPKLY
jgi:hypothetical protein